MEYHKQKQKIISKKWIYLFTWWHLYKLYTCPTHMFLGRVGKINNIKEQHRNYYEIKWETPETYRDWFNITDKYVFYVKKIIILFTWCFKTNCHFENNINNTTRPLRHTIFFTLCLDALGSIVTNTETHPNNWTTHK